MKSRYWLAAIVASLWLMLLAPEEGFSQAEGSVQVSEEQKLVPSELTDFFGRSVAVSGDVTVVGSARPGDVPGAVYVFRVGGAPAKWREEEVLLASDGEATDGFGDSVAISGDVVLVGAPLDDETAESSGSAYIFRYDGVTWLQEAKFQAFDGRHGNSVAVSGDVAVVGATDHAHVFRHDGVEWTEEQILVASDFQVGDLFGNSVAIDGDVIVVGSERDDANGTNTGSAYVFGYDGMMWLEEAKLLASDGQQVGNFGRSVGIPGDVIIVGVLDLPFGGAYIYRFDGSSWLEETKLLPSDPAFDDRFGFSVAVSDDLAVVGAWAHFHGADGSGARPGGAYVFRYDGAAWVERAELRASDAAAGDRLGEFVGISRDVTVAGAPGDDDFPDDDAGSGYVFRVPDLTCTADCRDFVTLVSPASNSTQESVLRIVNRAETTTEITIEAFDDAGSAAAGGRFHLTLAPRASRQLTAQDLEQGNTEKGFGSLGDGIGKWQLEVRSDGVIEVISLIRTPDGFLTSVDDIAPKTSMVNEIYIANPATNQNQQTFLRFVNQSDAWGFVTLSGVDDTGSPAPGTNVTFTLGPRESKQLTSRDFEDGNQGKGLNGALGKGAGKWHLTAVSDVDLEVMSLIRTPDGFLTNLSATAPTDVEGNHRIYYANPASETEQATVIRIVNRTTNTGNITISGIDDNGDAAPGGVVRFELGPLQSKQLLATDLENGNAEKGLIGALSDGAGKWQLTVAADTTIAVLNLIRTADGFLTNLSRIAPKTGSGLSTTEVYLANPGSNAQQRSLLRIVNTTRIVETVTITGVDDNGDDAPGGSVSFELGAGEGVVLTLQELENPNFFDDLSGALGDGAGKWHLTVDAPFETAVMSLLDTPTGFITNLSRPSDN